MPDDVPTIRLATIEDLDAICAIYNHEVAHTTATFDTEPRAGERAAAWFTGHDPARHPITVCESGGVVAGWASLSAWSERCAYDGAAETSVYVQTEFRGRGIARLLYDDLIERAKRHGFTVLLARLAIPNKPTERLHEAVGFREIGVMRRIGEKFGERIDVRLMDLHLD